MIHLGTVVWLKRGQVKTVSHPACQSGSGEGGPVAGQQLIFLFPLASHAATNSMLDISSDNWIEDYEQMLLKYILYQKKKKKYGGFWRC